MRKTMLISVIFSTLCFFSLMIPSSGDADFYVIPVVGQAKINPADVVHAYVGFNTSSTTIHTFDRILSDGTFVNDWQIPANKKLVITN